MSTSHNTNLTDSIFLQSLNPLHAHSNLFSTCQIPESEPLNPQNNPTVNQEIDIEKEITRAITSGNSESLQPNSGQSVPIGDHYVCVSFHEEADSGCRIWEWHGHVVCYDERNGYTQEYIYGNYFVRKMTEHVFVEESDEVNNWERRMGLRDLVAGLNLKDGPVLRRGVNITPNCSRVGKPSPYHSRLFL